MKNYSVAPEEINEFLEIGRNISIKTKSEID